MALVLVPTALQRLTNGQSRLTVHGATLRACIDELEGLYPGFHERLVDAEGEVQPQIAIYVTGQDVRSLQDLGTSVRPNDEIMIVPAIAGGTGDGDDVEHGHPEGDLITRQLLATLRGAAGPDSTMAAQVIESGPPNTAAEIAEMNAEIESALGAPTAQTNGGWGPR